MLLVSVRRRLVSLIARDDRSPYVSGSVGTTPGWTVDIVADVQAADRAGWSRHTRSAGSARCATRQRGRSVVFVVLPVLAVIVVHQLVEHILDGVAHGLQKYTPSSELVSVLS